MAEHVPEQIDGKAFDYFKTVDFSDNKEAQQLFDKIKVKLLDVNNWHRITGTPSAEFAVMDEYGLPLDRPAQKGDYIRIDIPGPGLPSAEGYDWVQVEAIREDYQDMKHRLSITLRPSQDPTSDNTDVAHFFKRIATSSIVVEQKQSNIFIHYAGRNEIVNTDNESSLDNLRNFMVGIAAKMGASFPQWQALVEGLGNLHLSITKQKRDENTQKKGFIQG